MLLLAALLILRITPDTPELMYKQPQLATDGRVVALTYAAGNTVYFARSDNGGESFAAAIKVSDSGKLSLGMHRGPRVAITSNSIVVSAVVGEKGKGADGDLVAWRSTDGGKTWSAGVKVNDVPGAAREGLHSMAAGGKNTLFATWLDLREKGTRLYGSVSRDGGITWSKNVLVYESPSGTICQCCHPTAVAGPEGNIAVMFRNELNGARDMYVVTSEDGGKTFGPAQKMGDGTWMLNACPMDGGDVVINRSGSLSGVWRREKIVYLSAVGAQEKAIATGRDATVAEGASGVYVAWTGAEGVQAKVPNQPEPLTLDANGAFVRLLAIPQGKVLAAWESKGSIVVQRRP